MRSASAASTSWQKPTVRSKLPRAVECASGDGGRMGGMGHGPWPWGEWVGVKDSMDHGPWNKCGLLGFQCQGGPTAEEPGP